MSFVVIMKEGGPLMWIIFGFGLIALFIFLEKLFYFHRSQVNVGELVSGLINVLKRDGMIEAISLCDNTPGPVARVLNSAILSYEKGDEEKDIRHAVEDAAMVEVPKLEARLNIIGTIGFVAPLMGLLGTVIGMMNAFQTIRAKEVVYLTIPDFAGDISMALTTTAAGLCVAIPCHIAYNYLVARVEVFTVDMEKSASEIVYFLKNHRNAKNGNSDENGTVN